MSRLTNCGAFSHTHTCHPSAPDIGALADTGAEKPQTHAVGTMFRSVVFACLAVCAMGESDSVCVRVLRKAELAKKDLMTMEQKEPADEKKMKVSILYTHPHTLTTHRRRRPRWLRQCSR